MTSIYLETQVNEKLQILLGHLQWLNENQRRKIMAVASQLISMDIQEDDVKRIEKVKSRHPVFEKCNFICIYDGRIAYYQAVLNIFIIFDARGEIGLIITNNQIKKLNGFVIAEEGERATYDSGEDYISITKKIMASMPNPIERKATMDVVSLLTAETDNTQLSNIERNLNDSTNMLINDPSYTMTDNEGKQRFYYPLSNRYREGEKNEDIT